MKKECSRQRAEGGAKLPWQELVDYVQRAEKSLEPGAESEKMKLGRWAGGPSPRALQGILRGLDFMLLEMENY